MEPPKPPSPPSAASAGSHVFLPALRDASRHSQRVSGRQRGWVWVVPTAFSPLPTRASFGVFMPRMGAAFWLPFFWRGKSGAVGCLLRVLLHPRSNADPTTSDPSAFPASPCCPLALGLGCGMGMVLALLFFLCFVSGF